MTALPLPPSVVRLDCRAFVLRPQREAGLLALPFAELGYALSERRAVCFEDLSVRAVLPVVDVSDCAAQAGGVVDPSRAAVAGPRVVGGREQASLAEGVGYCGLDICHRAAGVDVCCGDEHVGVGGADVASDEQPTPGFAVGSDCRIGELTLLWGERYWRRFEAAELLGVEGCVGRDGRRAGDVVVVVDTASGVAAEALALAGEGEEIGEWGGHWEWGEGGEELMAVAGAGLRRREDRLLRARLVLAVPGGLVGLHLVALVAVVAIVKRCAEWWAVSTSRARSERSCWAAGGSRSILVPRVVRWITGCV